MAKKKTVNVQNDSLHLWTVGIGYIDEDGHLEPNWNERIIVARTFDTAVRLAQETLVENETVSGVSCNEAIDLVEAGYV
jgi:hypothetical protein